MMEEPVTALAWGVLIAGVAQLAFQLPFLKRLGLLAMPRVSRAHEGVRRIVRLMMPAAFGASVAQINLLVDTLIASFLVTGSVSWLYYSDRMVEFPLGVFAIAMATVILPSLSQQHAEEAGDSFSDTLDWAHALGAGGCDAVGTGSGACLPGRFSRRCFSTVSSPPGTCIWRA